MGRHLSNISVGAVVAKTGIIFGQKSIVADVIKNRHNVPKNRENM